MSLGALATTTMPFLTGVKRPIKISSDMRRWLIEAGIVFIAYYLAGRLGQASAERSSNLGPVWPAYGIALAALLRCGNRMIPAVAAAAIAVASQSGVPIIVAVGQAMSSTIAAFTGSWLLRKFSFDCSLSRFRDAFGLVLLGGVLSPIVSASLGTAVLYLGNIEPYAHVWRAWLVYWMGDGTGVLLATPLALSIGRSGWRLEFDRVAEYTALIALLFVPCVAIFGNLGLAPVGEDCLTFSVLPFTMWAAIRFGVLGTAFSTGLIATLATIATAHGYGPFARSAAFTNAVLLDIFYAVLSVTGITLAALMAERVRAETQRDELIRQQAAAQAREEAENKAAVLRDELAHLSRVEMLSALSGALAHEINQPLAAIRVNIEASLFFLDKKPMPLEELRGALVDIREDSKRAGEVLKQVRVLLKKGVASHQDLELNSAVEIVAKLVQFSALKRGIRLDIMLAPQTKPVRGDRVQIQQVVMNLLMNACDAVESREKSLRYVRLTTSFSQEKAVVAVMDTGVGLSDSEMEHLFEPFYTTKKSGMGLGLAICRSIVQAHNGTLRVTQNPEGGSTFVVELPLSRPELMDWQGAATSQEVRFHA
jgi:signal transduction histidine kinase